MVRRYRVNEGIPIPLNALRIGMSVHLKGHDFGCVWIVTKIESPDASGKVMMWIKTPQTGEYKKVDASRARYVRANQPL